MPVEHVTSAVKEWAARRQAYTLYENYYAGRHELKFVTRDWQAKYAAEVLRGTVMAIRENLCPAVVTGFTDAIAVTSWGIGTDDAVGQVEGLSRLLGYVVRECWKTGDAYVLVWPDGKGDPRPVFQRAHHMVPHVDPTNPAVLDWCARVWADTTTKRGRVNIYCADRVERWETQSVLATDSDRDPVGQLPEQASAWRPCTDAEGDMIPHAFGVVPVCWFKLDASDPVEHGISVLNDVIPLQDGLNASLAHMLINQEAYSRPFWYLLNFKPSDTPANPYLPSGPDAGPSPRQAFDRTRQSIVTHDGPGPFGQLDPPDLTRLLEVQAAFKAKVCAVAGIPAYVMQAEIGSVPSGAALRTLERRRTDRIIAWQNDATPVLRGLKQLLGMKNGPIAWAPPIDLDELERWQIAEIQQSLGYALADILSGLGETDVAGIAARAADAKAASATAAAQAFLDGRGASSYTG
nr:MAG TPA: portal [Caudoviricetes sp.]